MERSKPRRPREQRRPSRLQAVEVLRGSSPQIKWGQQNHARVRVGKQEHFCLLHLGLEVPTPSLASMNVVLIRRCIECQNDSVENASFDIIAALFQVSSAARCSAECHCVALQAFAKGLACGND